MLRWALLMLLMLGLPGCALFRALFMPESVIGDAAGRVAGGAAQAVDNVATQQSVNDLDRILSSHGDAVNNEELQRLRTDLEENPLAGTGKKVEKPVQIGPPHEFDRRQAPEEKIVTAEKLPSNGGMRQAGSGQNRGNNLAVSTRIGSTHRGLGEPFAVSRGHILPPAEQRLYQVDVRQVRAQPANAAESRRADP